MKNIIIRVCNKIIYLLSNKNRGVPEQTPESIQASRVVQWFKDQGDKTHRLNYELNPNSLVLDLGGYEGQWSSDIIAKYSCKIMVFEPYIPYAESIENRFKMNSKVQVFRFGLGARTEKVGFSILDNASSVYANSLQTETIDIHSVTDFLRENSISAVDLIKINIEGGEYELLENLIENNMIRLFKNIQVQFHDFIIDNAYERMSEIQKKLAVTHELTYQYEFVWENWVLKK